MSFLNSLRSLIATAIAPSAIVINVPQGAKSLTHAQAPRHILNQQEHSTPMVGQFHVSDLDVLSSDYLRDAVAQLGAWSALARAFSEYERALGSKVADMSKFESLVEEFHCWNAATTTNKQMDEQAIILAADKIATVRPAKGNADTDKIIARVRKCSVEELRTDREAKAATASAKRQDMLTGFVAATSHYSGSDLNPSIPNAKVAVKAIQTMEWVASNWNGAPEGIAAELLLIEGDLTIVERRAAREDARDDRGFIDGTLTADHMMEQAERR